MKKRVIAIIILLFIASIDYGQVSFTLLVQTENEERIFDAAEDDDGNYYCVGLRSNIETLNTYAFFLAINHLGQIIFEQDYNIQDSMSYFGSIHIMNDSLCIFGAKGPIEGGIYNQLWYLVFNLDFEVLLDRDYSLNDSNLVDLETMINSSHNYVITGVIGFEDEEPDLCFFEVSKSGDCIKRSIISLEYGQFEYDLLELDCGGYKIFSYGSFPGGPDSWGKIVTVDDNFNYLQVDSIPYGLYFNHSAKWFDDTSYLVTGNKRIYDPAYRIDVGIVKLKEDDDFINGNHFGKSGDTISMVGGCSNLDFKNIENIYFGGASNLYPPNVFYNSKDSWLLLINLDSDLNLNWQRFYGGDACYYLWGLKATQDGGCLMLATRYDEMTQFQELDVFILKVDSNGLLTSTGEAPHIPSNELILYPNPARSQITVRYPDIFNHREREIIIWNTLGTAVRRLYRPPGQAEEPVDISAFPPGLYIAVLYADDEKIAVGKFVVH